MIAKGLRDILVADSAVSGLLVDRVYPGGLPQGGGFPAVSISMVSGGGIPTIEGRGLTRTVRMQVDCWAETPDDADALAKAVRIALDGYIGPLDEDHAQAVLLANEQAFEEPEVDLHQVALDFMVTVQEPA